MWVVTCVVLEGLCCCFTGVLLGCCRRSRGVSMHSVVVVVFVLSWLGCCVCLWLVLSMKLRFVCEDCRLFAVALSVEYSVLKLFLCR